jgi:hypothetical protein
MRIGSVKIVEYGHEIIAARLVVAKRGKARPATAKLHEWPRNDLGMPVPAHEPREIDLPTKLLPDRSALYAFDPEDRTLYVGKITDAVLVLAEDLDAMNRPLSLNPDAVRSGFAKAGGLDVWYADAIEAMEKLTAKTREASWVMDRRIEEAIKRLVQMLGDGLFDRASLERGGGEIDADARLRVDGEPAWEARWVREGTALRLETRWLADPERFA